MFAPAFVHRMMNVDAKRRVPPPIMMNVDAKRRVPPPSPPPSLDCLVHVCAYHFLTAEDSI
jgi:hypothetical protein